NRSFKVICLLSNRYLHKPQNTLIKWLRSIQVPQQRRKWPVVQMNLNSFAEKMIHSGAGFPVFIWQILQVPLQKLKWNCCFLRFSQRIFSVLHLFYFLTEIRNGLVKAMV